MAKPTSFIVINESGIRGDQFAQYWDDVDAEALKAEGKSLGISMAQPTRHMVGDLIFLTYPITEPALTEKQKKGEEPKPIDILQRRMKAWNKTPFTALTFGIASDAEAAKDVADGIAQHFLSTRTTHFILGVHCVDGKLREIDSAAYCELWDFIKPCQGYGRHRYALAFPDITDKHHPQFGGYLFATIKAGAEIDGAIHSNTPPSREALEDAWGKLEAEQNLKGGPRTYTWNGQQFPARGKGAPQAIAGRTLAEVLQRIMAHRPDLTKDWPKIDILTPTTQPMRNDRTIIALNDSRIHIPQRWTHG